MGAVNRCGTAPYRIVAAKSYRLHAGAAVTDVTRKQIFSGKTKKNGIAES
jgi:hypothetical protein